MTYRVVTRRALTLPSPGVPGEGEEGEDDIVRLTRLLRWYNEVDEGEIEYAVS